ncbi:MAG: hypothetical protein ACSHYA_12630 [Opitutaceae bacterium]
MRPLIFIIALAASTIHLNAAENYWKTSDHKEGVEVKSSRPAGAPESESWFHFKDESDTNGANIRHGINPITKGSLSFRLHVVKAIDISTHLGDGPASKPHERIVQVVVNDTGRVKIQSANPSVSSQTYLELDQTYTLKIRFEPLGDDKTQIWVDILEDGELLETVEGVTPMSRPIDMMRITTFNADVGGEFYITDLQLEGE